MASIRKRSYLIVLVIFLVCLLFLSFCSRQPLKIEEITTEEEEIEVFIDPILIQAAEIVSSMDDKLLTAQVIISGIDGNSSLTSSNKSMFTDITPGGIMLFRVNLDTNAATIKSFISQITSFITDISGIPPFIAVDHEGGTVNRFSRDVTTLPSAHTYWSLFESEGLEAAIAKIEEDSKKTSRDINDLGFNMNFAPVAEHLNDDNRSFLRYRSYGPDITFTAQAAASFLQNMEENGILCVVKHFPGSAGPDPHFSKSEIKSEKDALDILISPFAELIKNGARAIMAAHTSVPAIDSEIASLSSVVMGNWLRDELGFNGIIISDDFVMAAVGNLKPEEAAVLSVIAGSDMILVWPYHLLQTHQALLSALEDGRLPRERLQDAAVRIIYEKIRMGLIDINF